MNKQRTGALIVAHPDDETLWAGGLILADPDRRWLVVTLCRGGDADRAPRFFRALQHLGVRGAMADLDDEPEQAPLPSLAIEQTLLGLLRSEADGAAAPHFDWLVTHGPCGEYTRHRRHEETCRAVVALWQGRQVTADALWMFAYEDGGRQYLPQAQQGTDRHDTLPEAVWQVKYHLVTHVYGFAPDSWEARTTPREEAFWRFESPAAAQDWVMAKQPGECPEGPRQVTP